MSNEEKRGLLDEIVELAARAMDAIGLDGRRLRWRWGQRRRTISERKEAASWMIRSARGRHKMCPSCRALVPRSAGECTECGESLARVSRPGFARVLSQVFPGVTATTSLILLANGFWFLMMLTAQFQSGAGSGLLSSFGGPLLFRFGAGFSPAILAGEWWRLITPIFLHGGLLHFGFNSYVLMQLGPLTESEYGRERFWVIYLVSGIAGNALATVIRPMGGVVGASGAIFGLVGLLMVYGWRRGGAAGRRLKTFMVRYALLMLVLSLLPGISLSAHAGGFVAGAAMGLLVPWQQFRNRATARVWEVLSIAGVLLVIFAFYQVAQHARQ